MESLLEVKNLCKMYPNSQFELKDISFSIPCGSIVGFIGENGAGKTTTMGAIVGTLEKDNGSIKLFNQEINQSNRKKKEQISVVFDQMNFSSHINVIQLSNVLSHIYQQWDREKYFHYIEVFSLPKKEKIGSFSRGMSMKLSISLMLQMFIGGVEDFDWKFSTIFFIVSIIFFSISYVISIIIYKNKEF